MYIYHIFCIHSSVRRHLGLFKIILLWALGCMYLFKLEFSSFSEHITRNGTPEPYHNSIFSFLRNLHTVLPSGYAAAAAKSLQSCLTLCDPIDSSPWGSPVPGILQARTLEWVAISFFNAKVKSESEVAQFCPTLSDPMDYSLPGSSVHGIFQARVLEWGAIAFSLVAILNTNSLMCCFPGGSVVKNPPAVQDTWVWSLGW